MIVLQLMWNKDINVQNKDNKVQNGIDKPI